MEDEQAEQGQTDQHVDTDEMARLQEEINSLPVSEHLVFMLHSLSSLAVDRLGLAEDAAARRDAGQARLAIDAFKALLGVLEQARPTAEIGAYRGMLSQLQMAYVGALSPGAAPSRTEAPAQPAGGAAHEAASAEEAAAAPETLKKPAKPRPPVGSGTGAKPAAGSAGRKSGKAAAGGAKAGGAAGAAGGAAGGAAKGSKKSS